MTAPLSGQFDSEPSKVGGMFGGPRGSKGHYDAAGLKKLSGTTYGGQGLGWFWQGYPNVISGVTEYDPASTMPGSNMSAIKEVDSSTAQLMRDAGNPSSDTTGYSQGGTNY